MSEEGAISESPLEFVVSRSEVDSVCSHCLSSAKLRRCSGCVRLFFCSPECQAASWAAVHKWECARLPNFHLDQELYDIGRLALRLLLLRAKRPAKLSKAQLRSSLSLPPSLGWPWTRNFDSLLDHAEMMNDDDLEAIRVALRPVLKGDLMPDPATLRSFVGKISVNALPIFPDNVHRGIGLYTALSGFDHACSPNAVVEFRGGVEATLIPLDPNVPLSELRLSYIGFELLPRVLRRRVLRQRFFFDCECPLCAADDLDYLRFDCGRGDGDKSCQGRLVLRTPFLTATCGRCGRDVDKAELKRLLPLVELGEHTLSRLKTLADARPIRWTPILEAVDVLTESMAKEAAACPVWLLRCHSLAIRGAEALERWPRLADARRAFLGLLQHVLHPANPQLLQTQLDLATDLCRIRKKSEAKAEVRAAASAALVFGPEHRLCRRAAKLLEDIS